MEVLGYSAERIGEGDFEFNYKLTKGTTTIFLIRSLGRLLPVLDNGTCGLIKGFKYFTDNDGKLTPMA